MFKRWTILILEFHYYAKVPKWTQNNFRTNIFDTNLKFRLIRDFLIVDVHILCDSSMMQNPKFNFYKKKLCQKTSRFQLLYHINKLTDMYFDYIQPNNQFSLLSNMKRKKCSWWHQWPLLPTFCIFNDDASAKKSLVPPRAVGNGGSGGTY